MSAGERVDESNNLVGCGCAGLLCVQYSVGRPHLFLQLQPHSVRNAKNYFYILWQMKIYPDCFTFNFLFFQATTAWKTPWCWLQLQAWRLSMLPRSPTPSLVSGLLRNMIAVLVSEYLVSVSHDKILFFKYTQISTTELPKFKDLFCLGPEHWQNVTVRDVQ